MRFETNYSYLGAANLFLIYWGLPCCSDDVLKEMSVYSDTPGQAEEVLSYVLRPTQLLIKLIHNEKLDPRYPQYVHVIHSERLVS